MEQVKSFNRTIEERVAEYVDKHGLIHDSDKILAGVSGGADSVCLLFVLHGIARDRKNISLGVVHVHHMLRNEQADRDLEYVSKLCRMLDVPFYERHCPVRELAAEWGMTLEEAGRRARYDTFEEVCRTEGYNTIAVAHHKDDQAETLLMNLFRGSGIHGMAGMRPRRDSLIRPLLCISREETERYLDEQGIAYCTDATNYENDYTRNRIRNELLPYIKEHINKGAAGHIVQFGERAAEIDCYFQKITKTLFAKYGRIEENAVILDVECLQEERLDVHNLIRHALERTGAGLKDITADHIDKIYHIMKGRTGAVLVLPRKLRVEKSYGHIRFWQTDGEDAEYRQVDGEDAISRRNGANIMPGQAVDVELSEDGKPVSVCYGGLEFTFSIKKFKKNETFPKKKYTKWFDYDKIESMLQLRTRKTGDCITVCADGGTKSLKKYFIDAKVPRMDRERVVLLADGSRIVWIVGQRTGEQYKVQADTKRILEVVCAGTSVNNGG